MRMRQTIAEVIGKTAGENLRLIFQTAKGARVDDTIAVTLEVIAIGMRRFRIAASAGLLDSHSVRGEHGFSVRDQRCLSVGSCAAKLRGSR